MSMLPKEQVLPPRQPKAMLLFVLPVPLLAVMLGKLVSGELLQAGAAALALGGFYTGAALVRRGLIQDLFVAERQHIVSRPTPFKLIGSAIVAATTFGTSLLLGGGSLIESAGFAAGALFGSLFFYGFDKVPEQKVAAGAEPEVVSALAQAESKILAIEHANASINCVELTDRLGRITGQAREVVDVLAEQPDKLRRARKFLSTYLNGAERVAVGYAKTHNRTQSQELDDNFRQVLITIEDVFKQQHSKLLEDDVLDLDVQIEVLKTQLEREGVG